jgi:hypothetical protein
MDRGQTGRYTKSELSVLKSAFSGNEELLYEVRDVMLGFRNKLSNPLMPEVLQVLRKFLLPEISAELPLGRQSDLYVGMDDFKNFPPESAVVLLQARELAIDYLKERFTVLEGKESNWKVADFLERDKGVAERHKNFLAYSFLVTSSEAGGRHIESRMYEIEALCLQKEETEEEKKARLKKDSNK